METTIATLKTRSFIVSIRGVKNEDVPSLSANGIQFGKGSFSSVSQIRCSGMHPCFESVVEWNALAEAIQGMKDRE